MPQPNVSAAPIDNSKVSPETQAIMDMFVINGMELIYDEKQVQTMLPRLSAGEDPTKSMAELLLDIVNRIVSSAKDAGKEIPPEVILHGSNILFGELLKVLDAAGMAPLSEEQKTAVWQLFSSSYIDQAIKSGQMTEQEIILLSKGIKQTEEGKKIMQTAKNPTAAVKNLNLNKPGQPADAGVEPVPGAMAAPQGGM
jgi:hypothetical protein